MRLDNRRIRLAHRNHAYHQRAGVVLPTVGMGRFHQRIGGTLGGVVQS